MGLAINDTAPDFEAETTQGKIRFHDWIGDGWAVLFSHPKDFTPVCTTELGYMARIHSVTNPIPRLTGAIHVYGGDFFNPARRSEWDPETLLEQPWDPVRAMHRFEEKAP